MSASDTDIVPSAFSKVPEEILSSIAAHLPKKDLMHFRLVDRKASRVASDFMCRSVILDTWDSSVRRLKNISESPFWAKQVRSVYWSLCLGTCYQSDDECDFVFCGHHKKYLRKLPSVNSVCFYGREVKPKHETTLELLDDIEESQMRPARAINGDTELHLEYNDEGHMESIKVQVTRGKVPTPDELGQSMEYYKGLKNKPTKYYSISFLAFAGSSWNLLSQLRSVTISGVYLKTGFLRKLLICSKSSLEMLTLDDIWLANRGPRYDLHDFVGLQKTFCYIKICAETTSRPSLQVNFINVHAEWLDDAVINATSDEITRWIKGDGDDWYEELMRTHNVCAYDEDETPSWDSYARYY